MEGLFLEGMLLQASLIFALGAQNIFVMEAGLNREFPLLVSFVCFLCDLTLIMLGVAGAATLLNEFPQARIILGLGGSGFLLFYGFSKLFSNLGPSEDKEVQKNKASLKRAILLSLTFSLLNPHAYLDAFILIGGYSTKYGELGERLLLGLGAAAFSGLWFLLLSSGSSYMKPLLTDPARMKKIMALSGVFLIILSGKLGMDMIEWIQQDIIQNDVVKNTFSYPVSPGHLFTTILF